MQPPEPSPRAVLFDAMGTLVRLDPPGPRLRRELHRRFGLALSAAEAEAAMAAEIALYRERMHAASNPGQVNELRDAAAEALRGGLPADRRLPEVPTAALVEVLLAVLQFTAYPDAAPALGRLRQRGLRTVVVSNWDSSLPEVLDRVGLAGLLDGIIISSVVGAAKPDPEIFAAALACAGVAAEEALHVGDDLDHDVAGARAAGIGTLWLDRTGSPAPPHVRRITSLAALARLV